MLTLYTTLGCHLCEQARSVITDCLSTDCALTLVDIAEDPILMQRYGLRIPVVVTTSGRELGWPFDAAQFLAWYR